MCRGNRGCSGVVWGCLSLLKCVFVGVVPGLLGYSCAEKPEEVEPRWLLEPGLPALGCSGLFVLCKLKLLLPFPPAASPKVTLCERAKGQMAIFFFFFLFICHYLVGPAAAGEQQPWVCWGWEMWGCRQVCSAKLS